MSLFKSREWWSVNLNENEMYDSNCLLVAHVGNRKYQLIILGSHEGLLRFYDPSSEMLDDGSITGFKPSDLLLESHLQHPILMLGLGTFVSGSQDKFLAVLHPRLLSIYGVSQKEAANQVEVQVTLDLVYQHQLRHSAYSFVSGPFGGVQRRDFICILSLDGLLTFYEQESLTFQVYIPDFLIPAPFVYLEKTDTFVFLNASQELDCYSYEMLAALGTANETNPRKISKVWSHNIGEYVLNVATVVSDVLNVLVLTERNLYNLNENGKFIFTKRLEYKPTSFHCYLTAETKKLMVMVSTDSNFLNVYDGTCLKWCTKIDQTPVGIATISVKNLRGGLVLLSEHGLVQCTYLGTLPSLYLIPPLNQQELDMHEAELELRQIRSDVSEHDLLNTLTEDVINVKLEIGPSLEDNGFVKACTVVVHVHTTAPLNKVQVLFAVDPPLVAANNSVTVTSVCDKSTVSTTVYPRGGTVVSSLEVRIAVSYSTNGGVPRLIQTEGQLPLALALEACAPAKEALYKLTVITNKPVCPMNQIFHGLTTDETSTNVIGLKFVNSEAMVTIIGAKTSQRYRLQSDSMEAVTLPLTHLVDHLKKYFQKVSDFNLSYASALPLQIYFERIETYFELIKKRRTLQVVLGKRTCQFRTIQKKVLINLRDVTPKPASNLHKILKDTHGMVMEGIGQLEEADRALCTVRCSISSLSRLQITLLGLMTIGSKDLDILRVVFCPKMYDNDEQGWLEVQGAAAAFCLRTHLAKSSRDQHKATDITLDPVTEVAKFLKRISSVVDRVTKGVHLLERNEFESEKENLPTMPALKEVEGVSDEVVPTGSKLADLRLSEKAPLGPARRVRSPAPAKPPTPEPAVPSFLQVQEPETHEVETVATIEAVAEHEPVNGEEEGAKRAEEDQEDEEEEGVIEKPPRAMNVEDDEIWDLEVDEMRI